MAIRAIDFKIYKLQRKRGILGVVNSSALSGLQGNIDAQINVLSSEREMLTIKYEALLKKLQKRGVEVINNNQEKVYFVLILGIISLNQISGYLLPCLKGIEPKSLPLHFQAMNDYFQVEFCFKLFHLKTINRICLLPY